MKVLYYTFALANPLKPIAMIRFISALIAALAICIPAFAQTSSNSTSSKQIELNIHQNKKEVLTSSHRAPLHIYIEAIYNEVDGVIEIIYDGDAEGECFLYLNGQIVGYAPEINATFQTSGHGLYLIEIVSETWSAQGSIRL